MDREIKFKGKQLEYPPFVDIWAADNRRKRQGLHLRSRQLLSRDCILRKYVVRNKTTNVVFGEFDFLDEAEYVLDYNIVEAPMLREVVREYIKWLER